jgi:hypothetical protein
MTFDATSLAPITTAISDATTNLVPIGLGVMGTFIGIAMLKRVVYSFL